VAQLLSAADGVELLVLAPEQRKGFLVELEVVRNVAHLGRCSRMRLVGRAATGLLLGPRIDTEIAAIATERAHGRERRIYSLGWNFQAWYGVSEGPEVIPLRVDLGHAALQRSRSPIYPSCAARRIVLMRPRQMDRRVARGALLLAAARCAAEVGSICGGRSPPAQVDAWLPRILLTTRSRPATSLTRAGSA